MVTIGFFSNDTFMPKLIKFITHSPVNHVAVGFMQDGKPMWLESSSSGVKIVDRGYLSGLYAEFEIIPDVYNEVILAEKKVGEPYADLTMLGYLFVYLGRLLHIKINNPFYEKSAAVCSEFIIEMDSEFIIHEFQSLDPADVSPDDLLDICERGRSFKKIL
jgi:hypothetical protein